MNQNQPLPDPVEIEPFVQPPVAPLPPTEDSPEESKHASGEFRRAPLPKPVLFLMGGLLLVGLFFGLFKFFTRGRSTAPGKEVELTYWGLWEPNSVMNGVIVQFEADHPGIKIKYEMRSPRGYKAKLQNALNGGEGPDIFRLHHTWAPLLSKEMSPVPGPIKEKLGLETNYFSVITRALQYQGCYYALPLMTETLALYYNKDLLDQVGGKLPRTWWGLQKLAKQITKTSADDRISTAGVALGTTNNVDHFSDIIGLMILQDGGNPAKPDERVENVLKYYTQFATKDKVWDETLPNSTLQFAAGKLGFYFAPSWRYHEIKAANPGLNFGISTVPQLPESREIDWEAAEAGEAELTNINWASFWVEGVSVNSPYQEQAWEFLGYLASAEGLGLFHQVASQLRDFGEIYPLKSLANNELSANPYLTPFIKQSESAQWWYLCSFTHDDSLNDGMIKYYGDAINEFSTGHGSTDTMETLQSGVNQLLERHRIN